MIIVTKKQYIQIKRKYIVVAYLKNFFIYVRYKDCILQAKQ